MTSEVLPVVESFATIDVNQIDPSPFQHRRTFDRAALTELGRSIAADGLLQPVTVRPVKGRFELIAGERRWRAAKEHAGLTAILARVLQVDDLQARRLCATENLQRADLTAIEEVLALAELIDAELTLAFGDEYRALSKLDEPKWRVKALLTAMESDRRRDTDHVSHKFMGQTDALFAGLPKPKERRSFTDNDLPLLFTADEVQQFAMEHRLNKSQTKAVAELHKADPQAFKSLVENAEQDTSAAFVRMVAEKAHDDAPTEAIKQRRVEETKKDVEDVRDLSAETIKKAAKAIKFEKTQQATIFATSAAPIEPDADDENPIQVGDWWRLGRHTLYCGDTSKPEFYERLPEVEFAFADPPYGVMADEWDSAFYWEHDWLIDKAPIVAVTPGQPAIVEFARKTSMPYRNSMASWITNGMTLSEFGYQNWIYLAFFARAGVKLFRQCQDIIRCTIDIGTTDETSHRGRKPAEMMVKVLDLYCAEQKTVIDPFLGSGTTLLIAEKTGRTCYGGELSPDYCLAILRRWEALTGERGVKQ